MACKTAGSGPLHVQATDGDGVNRPAGTRHPTYCGWPDRCSRRMLNGGCFVVAPVTASDRDLRALAGIVSQDRLDLPDGDGLPPSLLAEMKGRIRCDGICFMGFDSGRHRTWVLQAMPTLDHDDLEEGTDLDRVHWTHYWDSQPCSYPDRTGDLRSVLKIADFYSARQWRSTGMYCDIYRPLDIAHELQLCLPYPAGQVAGPGRTRPDVLLPPVRAGLLRAGPGGLTLLRPHLHQAYLDAERRRHPVPRLTPRQARPAAPARRRAHQHPDRPAAGHLRGNRAQPPGKHLRTAAGLQPYRRGHPRLR